MQKFLTIKWQVKLIEAEFGLTGFAVVVKLWQKIYGQEGYYCEWTEEVALLFRRELGLGGNAVSEIVSATLRRGLFDRELFDRYKILTSQGIQTRYFEAVGRRKGLEVKKQYLLVNVDKNNINVNINSINVSNNEENVCNNPQIKENKTKVNKNKVIYAPTERKETVRHKYGEYKNVLLSDDELNWNGAGTVKLIMMSSNLNSPEISEDRIESIKTAIDPTEKQGQGYGLAPIGHTVTVVSVKEKDVNVSMKAELKTGVEQSAAIKDIKGIINDYFRELSADWENKDNVIVRISHIESRILERCNSVEDIDIGTTANGETKSLILEKDEIPKLGTLSISQGE